MTSKKRQLFSDVLELSPMDRAALIAKLLHSFDNDTDTTAQNQAVWLAEARDRVEAYQRGEIPATDAEEFFEEIDRKFSN
jgi:putative addiction module component (TIGR02574 family)